jgi:hypothetical protein
MRKLLKALFAPTPKLDSNLATVLAYKLFYGVIEVEKVTYFSNLIIGFCEKPEITLLTNRDKSLLSVFYGGELIKFSTPDHAELFKWLFLYNDTVSNGKRVFIHFETAAYMRLRELFVLDAASITRLIDEAEPAYLNEFAENRSTWQALVAE